MNRAVIAPRIILGTFVLFLISGPLIAAAVDIQTTLSDSPYISEVAASIFEILVVLLVTGAIFSRE